MPRHPTRPLLILTLLALVVFAPTYAIALPQGTAALSAAERLDATPSLFSQLWSLFSALFSDTGSGLEPNGASAGPPSSSGTEPSASTGDTGSILEPNG
jgi:hypothetical protein